jgi:hypothetical protein
MIAALRDQCQPRGKMTHHGSRDVIELDRFAEAKQAQASKSRVFEATQTKQSRVRVPPSRYLTVTDQSQSGNIFIHLARSAMGKEFYILFCSQVTVVSAVM